MHHECALSESGPALSSHLLRRLQVAVGVSGYLNPWFDQLRLACLFSVENKWGRWWWWWSVCIMLRSALQSGFSAAGRLNMLHRLKLRLSSAPPRIFDVSVITAVCAQPSVMCVCSCDGDTHTQSLFGQLTLIVWRCQKTRGQCSTYCVSEHI